MAEGKRRALLGRIAEFGWFIQQGEPAATQSLAMLLEDQPLKHALLQHLEGLTHTDLTKIAYFVPEVIHHDGGRPDVEGQDESGRPVLVVEAKFGAALDSAQVQSYLVDQARRLGPDARGAFVLLVPPRRVQHAERVLQQALSAWETERSHAVSVGTGVVTWEECIRIWEDAVRGLPDGVNLACDLEQFRAMCLTLGGLVIPPLGDAAWGPAWRDREEDLRQIVHEVTGRFVSGGRFPPMGDEPGYAHRRYISGGDAAPYVSCSVGVGIRFADEGATPFWLRYHRQTPGFRLVQARIMSSRFAPQVRTDDRHIWLPLTATADAAGPEIVQQLAVQVADIIAAASRTDQAGAAPI